MKTLRIAMALTFAALLTSRGEDARFFRIAGPVATAITSFSADGYVTWTNTPTNATFTVQTASSLSGTNSWVDFVRIPTTNGVNTNRLFDPATPVGMSLIPAGAFTMGNTFSDEGESDQVPTNSLYVSEFYMDKYEVTKAIWNEVYQWATNHGYSFEPGAQEKASNHPSHSLTWYDSAKWCNARSEKEGKTPAYYTSAEQTTVYRTGQLTVDTSWVNWSSGYRLPTEAEWEKAARGGASGQRFPWGNTITHSRANYKANSVFTCDLSPTQGFHPVFNDAVYPYTNPAGYFAPNGYGLYDMAGNMWEWCWDWYGQYSSGSQANSHGPASGLYRVLRGGGWGDYAIYCTAASRFPLYPGYGGSNVGFRSVLPASQ